MQLQINEDYRLASDPQNVMIQQRTIVKSGKRKGETEWKTLGYYPNPEYALEKLLDIQIMSTDIEFQSIQELLEHTRDAKDEIRVAVKKKLCVTG